MHSYSGASTQPSKLKSIVGDIWSVAKNTTENIKAFVTGAGDAVVRNNTFNLINPQPTPDHQTAYYIGKTVGDAITGIQGMTEGTLGSVGEVGGLALDSTGGGLFAGLTLNAVSGLAISHAGAVLTTSNKNFGNDFGAIFHSNGSGSSEGTGNSDWVKMTNKQATDAANKLGFKPTGKYAKNGEQIFHNKKTKTYISQDIGSGNGMGPHKGGTWKQAKSPEKLNSKKTRMGTYDANLNRTGD